MVHSAIRSSELLIHTMTWMSFNGIMLRERNQSQKVTYCMSPLYRGQHEGVVWGEGRHGYRRRWAASEWAKLHLYLQPLPITCITTWAPPPVRSVAALDSHSTNPTVNCTYEGSRLRTPYENLMPDDLRWSWGGDASAGERLQIQIIISREVWLHTDHNKLIACRHIKTLSVSGKWQLSCIWWQAL